jgi:hypothetical protein
MPKKSVNDLILEEIRDMHVKLDDVRTKDIPKIREDLRELKVKSSMWGGISGLIGGILAVYLPRHG